VERRPGDLPHHLCPILWLGDLVRLQADPELRFFWREEIGHDLVGYPPPTVKIARGTRQYPPHPRHNRAGHGP
jgi:hypothetical protein